MRHTIESNLLWDVHFRFCWQLALLYSKDNDSNDEGKQYGSTDTCGNADDQVLIYTLAGEVQVVWLAPGKLDGREKILYIGM